MINKYRKKTINISNFRKFKAKMGCYFPVIGLGREQKREIVSVPRGQALWSMPPATAAETTDSRRPSLKKGVCGVGGTWNNGFGSQLGPLDNV